MVEKSAETACKDGSSTERISPLGRVLIKEKIVTEDQLREALRKQSKQRQDGDHVGRIGKIIVDLGYAKEEDVVGAINKHYSVSASSLSDDFSRLIKYPKARLLARLLNFHPPIALKLSIAFIVVVSMTTLTIGYIVIGKQKDLLYHQTVKMGKVSLNYFRENAKMPLLNDDIIRLNTLIKGP